MGNVELTQLTMMENGLLTVGTEVIFDSELIGCIVKVYRPEGDPLWAYEIDHNGIIYYRYANMVFLHDD